MTSRGRGINVRGEMVDMLLERIARERHPSAAMMDVVEQLLSPDDVPVYAGILFDKVKTERYPSLPMIRRLLAFT